MPRGKTASTICPLLHPPTHTHTHTHTHRHNHMSCTDSCRQCCRCCCYPCIHCCCKDPTEKPNKYPHVQYKSPEEAKVPLDKVFEFQQPRSDYAVHPQMTHIISEQPWVIQRGGTLEASERSSSSVSTTAETILTLQFSLYYDIQRRSLSVHLQQAYNLLT